ncbi:MAG: DUF6323 family protein [Hungatella hathewayi]|uniref:DUF6323 family protein n=1 Tax=Hungatella hathewayi TaxID=154046 RepID=UPI00325B83E9
MKKRRAFSNETLDLVSDDELLRYMRKAFNGVCRGFLNRLSERELFCTNRGAFQKNVVVSGQLL